MEAKQVDKSAVGFEFCGKKIQRSKRQGDEREEEEVVRKIAIMRKAN